MRRSPAAFLLLSLLLTSFLTAARLPAAPGPVRTIGPEGYVDNLRDLRHPDRADPGYLLALTQQALWSSRDGGASWRLLTPEFRFKGSLRNLAIDPFDLEHFFLIASDLEDRKWMEHLVETKDAGKTWSWRPFPEPSRGVNLQFDGQAAGRVIYQDFFGPQLSLDGGKSFAQIPAHPTHQYPPGPQFLAAHRGLLYFQANQALWTYAVAEQRWTRIAPLAFSVNELRGDLARADTLFARAGGDLYRSRNGGQTFERILDSSLFYPIEKFLQSPFNFSHLAALAGGKLMLSLDRGSTWTEEPRGTGGYFAAAASFDPATGELVFHENGGLARRRLDGGRQAIRPRGLFATAFRDVVRESAGNRLWALASDGTLFRRDGERSPWIIAGQAPCSESLSVTPWNPQRIFAGCFAGYYISEDGGATWDAGHHTDGSGYPPPIRMLFGPGSPGSTWLLVPFGSLSALDGPVGPVVPQPLVVDAVFHPDPQQGLLASYSDTYNYGLLEWKPAGGWTTLSSDNAELYYESLSQDPADPRRVYSLSSYGGIYFSADRGRSWAFRGGNGLDTGGILPQAGLELLVDRLDGEHLVAGGQVPLSESADGGRTWSFPDDFRYNLAIADDPAGEIYNAAYDALQARSPVYRGCADGDDNFCARQQRFELTVEWKTPDGASGVAKKIETGSEESGLFYFFDPNNWELLVKVLDGCAINQRFWVFTAGTTDVDYLLKVEDRWTGRIRTYWNAPGQAAQAVTDTDAFATCAEPAPAGAAAPAAAAAQPATAPAGAPAPLELLNGRFRAEAAWTDFQGQQGPGTPAPLTSANSGLFWFFSSDNWEVLLKVLDGCAINGHYWVLAAATTDVGYELRVSEPATGITRTYRNPVGRASPAQIDLQAFACANARTP